MSFKSIFLVATVLLGALVSAYAQPVPITKEEFDRLRNTAFARTETRVRRETTKSRTLKSGLLVEEELTTQDYSPPDRERWLILVRTPAKKTRVEIVYLGDVEYRREEKGPWKKIYRGESKEIMEMNEAPSAAKSKEIIEYAREETSLAGKKAQILSQTSNLAFAASSGLHINRITVDPSGYILKIEESVSEGERSNVVYTSVATIAYSSTPIVIAPRIK